MELKYTGGIWNILEGTEIYWWELKSSWGIWNMLEGTEIYWRELKSAGGNWNWNLAEGTEIWRRELKSGGGKHHNGSAIARATRSDSRALHKLRIISRQFMAASLPGPTIPPMTPNQFLRRRKIRRGGRGGGWVWGVGGELSGCFGECLGRRSICVVLATAVRRLFSTYVGWGWRRGRGGGGGRSQYSVLETDIWASSHSPHPLPHSLSSSDLVGWRKSWTAIRHDILFLIHDIE